MTQFKLEVTPTKDIDDATRAFLIKHATRDGSDFQQSLARWLPLQGDIAIVYSHGEIIGWCRSDGWEDEEGRRWETLEAFVRPSWRRSGIAAMAATAIHAGSLISDWVAVFKPSMLLVASRARLRPVLFTKQADGRWERSE
jgi:hypothetical protein